MRAVPRMRSAVALCAATAPRSTAGADGAAAAAQLVGLGDSYAAGPLIPNQSLNPLGCLRSDHNYAHLAAAQLGGRSATCRAAARRPTT